MNNSGARLSHLGVLRLRGADALGFLQGQLSNDMLQVGAGRCVLAACSSAQGRVLAIVRVFARGADVLMVLPHELISDTLNHLRKFVLRSKVQLDDASSELALGGCFGADHLSGAGVAVPAPDGCTQDADLTVATVAGDTQRFWVAGPPASLAQRLGWRDPDASFDQRWRYSDVQAGLPQIYAVTREAFVAQMLNLDLLQGISFTKGCYTGQEIIARTQNLGRIKRRLFRVELPAGDFQTGAGIVLADGRAGQLTEVAHDGGKTLALAVLNLEPASGTTRNDFLVGAQAMLPDYFPRE